MEVERPLSNGLAGLKQTFKIPGGSSHLDELDDNIAAMPGNGNANALATIGRRGCSVSNTANCKTRRISGSAAAAAAAAAAALAEREDDDAEEEEAEDEGLTISEDDDDDGGDAIAPLAPTTKPNGLYGGCGGASGSSAAAAFAALPAGHGRVFKRAKRAGRANSWSNQDEVGAVGVGGSGLKATATASKIKKAGGQLAGLAAAGKNMRRPRNGLGRGLPKKGGAGGKGVWGKLGCELDLPWVDPNDPNYDEDEEIGKAANGVKTSAVVGSGGNAKLKALVPEMSEDDVRKAVEPLVLEYFENNDTSEVIYTLQEMLMNLGTRRWMVVAIAVELAMDHKPSHREMASTLLSDLYQKVISQRDIGKAFDYLLTQLSDLTLDTPEAPAILGNFMARAIADDCIPPKFLASYKGNVECEEAKKALCKADTLLSMKHGLVRLDNVWGVGGGVRPVKYLIKKINLLLQEYLHSCDIQEATRCLTELEVPHFHHELVYEAVVMVIESMHEKTDEAMCLLLQALFRSFIITIEQMRNGFERVYDYMPEISLDVPAAYGILERFALRCRAAGFITDEVVRKMPTRGRKRFVSEGDGGRIKESWW